MAAATVARLLLGRVFRKLKKLYAQGDAIMLRPTLLEQGQPN
jgi:hypothetical protein